MQYVDGGSLAQEIERKSKSSPVEPYAERRIAFYALQVREDILLFTPMFVSLRYLLSKLDSTCNSSAMHLLLHTSEGLRTTM